MGKISKSRQPSVVAPELQLPSSFFFVSPLLLNGHYNFTWLVTRWVKTVSRGSVAFSCRTWAAEGCLRPATASRLLSISPGQVKAHEGTSKLLYSLNHYLITQTHTHTYLHAHMHVHMPTHTHMCRHICTHIHICMNRCVHAYMHMCTYSCTHARTYAHPCKHICMHAHTPYRHRHRHKHKHV